MLTPPYYYRRDGTPYEGPDAVLQWGRDFNSPEKRLIRQQKVRKWLRTVIVSTVWLGLDHQYGDGPPLIFETMVFGGPLDGEQQRYSTEAEAIAGHEAMVQRVKAEG